MNRPSLYAFALVALAPALALGAEPPAPEVLPLTQALARLEDGSFTLEQARQRAAEAKGIVRQAMAAFLPTVVASGSYTRNSAEAKLSMNGILDMIEAGLGQVSPLPVKIDRTNVPPDTIIQPLGAFTGAASVRVPIFAGHAYSEWLAAKSGAGAVEASVDVVRLQLRTAVVQAACWAQAAEDIAAASERALGVATEHERSAERRVKAGTIAPLALLQAQTEVVRRESDSARTRAERARAWLALGVLLGKAEPVRVTLPEAVASADGGAVDALSEQGLTRRPELRAQQASVRAAERQVDAAWWRLSPQVAGSFSVFASDVAYPTGDKAGWKATLELTWALYDGGFRYGKRAQAEAQLAGARAALEAQRVEVRQQVQDASRDIGVAAERLRLAGRQRALADEVYGSAKRSFEAGLASSLDVLDANDRLYQADVGVADARARLGVARAALARAIGASP